MKPKKKLIVESPIRKKAEIALDQWLVNCPEDHFERVFEFEGRRQKYGPKDFCIGAVVGPFCEIVIAGSIWAPIFHIDEIIMESERRYYEPIRRILELAICHPYYWPFVFFALLHEAEKATDDDRALMLKQLEQLDGLLRPEQMEQLKKAAGAK